MANPEHLERLKKGVKVWNRWYRKQQGTADLTCAYLDGLDLSAVDLYRVNLSSANLHGATLNNADLRYANLCDINFITANLDGARLSYANLRGAKLNGARLRQADLRDSELEGANLRGAWLSGTVMAGVDLGGVRGLSDVVHRSPSILNIDTIYMSRGKIPDKFLRGCGVPENFITYMKSLTGSAFEFYSVFISYSTKDQDFADRLHADLQDKGVRCWLATEDLKIGDPFRQRIDESIRLHDKLLLVLSEHSVQSSWVQDEVEAALERDAGRSGWCCSPFALTMR
jgi:uncharacterized protein YjbI with pentapeptide repeats